jgi:hypothetical protein
MMIGLVTLVFVAGVVDRAICAKYDREKADLLERHEARSRRELSRLEMLLPSK